MVKNETKNLAKIVFWRKWKQNRYLRHNFPFQSVIFFPFLIKGQIWGNFYNIHTKSFKRWWSNWLLLHLFHYQYEDRHHPILSTFESIIVYQWNIFDLISIYHILNKYKVYYFVHWSFGFHPCRLEFCNVARIQIVVIHKIRS